MWRDGKPTGKKLLVINISVSTSCQAALLVIVLVSIVGLTELHHPHHPHQCDTSVTPVWPGGVCENWKVSECVFLMCWSCWSRWVVMGSIQNISSNTSDSSYTTPSPELTEGSRWSILFITHPGLIRHERNKQIRPQIRLLVYPLFCSLRIGSANYWLLRLLRDFILQRLTSSDSDKKGGVWLNYWREQSRHL